MSDFRAASFASKSDSSLLTLLALLLLVRSRILLTVLAALEELVPRLGTLNLNSGDDLVEGEVEASFKLNGCMVVDN